MICRNYIEKSSRFLSTSLLLFKHDGNGLEPQLLASENACGSTEDLIMNFWVKKFFCAPKRVENDDGDRHFSNLRRFF